MEESDESGEEWNYTVPASTRLSTQTSERLDKYQEQEDIGKSEALRRLIRSGLDEHLNTEEEDEPESTETGDILLILGGLIGAGVLLGYASGGGNPDQWLLYLALGLVAAGLYARSEVGG